MEAANLSDKKNFACVAEKTWREVSRFCCKQYLNDKWNPQGSKLGESKLSHL